ncbi:hypothetical protein SAMN05428949_6031 [Chitinophaga sp. YR627]|nr:hypothetical protein SAMN05428949_6031 [Chitinophaga sp. YR627]
MRLDYNPDPWPRYRLFNKMEQNTILHYVNELRKNLTSRLKPNIGLQITIFNCGNEGAVLIVYFHEQIPSSDNFSSQYSKISDVLSSIKQDFVSGDLSSVNFKGTNIMMDQRRIILIKDYNHTEWTTDKAQEDINKILHTPTKSNRI